MTTFDPVRLAMDPHVIKTARHVAEETGLHPSTVRKRLNAMENSGLVEYEVHFTYYDLPDSLRCNHTRFWRLA